MEEIHLPSVENATPQKLLEYWKQPKFQNEQEVIGFYQQGHPYFGYFSNFKILPEYEFDIPFKELNISEEEQKKFPSPVKVKTSEKCIMLCKAVVMGDSESYMTILDSENPKAIKKLGRLIKPFDQIKYDKYICIIAYHIVFQKFLKGSNEIREYLKLTNSAIIAEAAHRDKNWGIGLGVKQYISKPALWKGCNILGWALMVTRQELFS